MSSYVPVVKNDSNGAILYTALADQAIPGKFKAAPSLSTGDVKISKDGGAFANLGTLPTVTPAGGSAVKIVLSQAETNADNLTIVFARVADNEWCDQIINFQTAAQHIDDIPTANQNADALLDRSNAIETSWSLRYAMRVMLAALAGKASGLDSGVAVFRNVGDGKDRITATVDSDGNRTAVALDGT